MGNETTVLVRPNLEVNGRRCDLHMLKNISVMLTTKSSIDQIPISKNYDNLEIGPNEEIEIKFAVPPNILGVELKMEAEIHNNTTGKSEKLSASKSEAFFNG